MRSNLIESFEDEYQRGELKELSECALPFLQKHWQDLQPFIARFLPLLGEERLDTIIKLFILHYNMPFDMALYMNSQRQFIEHTVNAQMADMTPEARREAVAIWIRENAQKHRHEAILKQVLCFDKVKEYVLPLVRKALAQGFVS